jgi:hypothetical protein
MPYVITIRTAFNDPRLACCGRDAADCDCESPVEFPTRTAVATLEEARAAAFRTVTDTPGYASCIGFPTDAAIATALTADGGTIGPLPDGTMIDVRPADWELLRHLSGNLDRYSLLDPIHPQILAAFNAR